MAQIKEVVRTHILLFSRLKWHYKPSYSVLLKLRVFSLILSLRRTGLSFWKIQDWGSGDTASSYLLKLSFRSSNTTDILEPHQIFVVPETLLCLISQLFSQLHIQCPTLNPLCCKCSLCDWENKFLLLNHTWILRKDYRMHTYNSWLLSASFHLTPLPFFSPNFLRWTLSALIINYSSFPIYAINAKYWSLCTTLDIVSGFCHLPFWLAFSYKHFLKYIVLSQI